VLHVPKDVHIIWCQLSGDHQLLLKSCPLFIFMIMTEADTCWIECSPKSSCSEPVLFLRFESLGIMVVTVHRNLKRTCLEVELSSIHWSAKLTIAELDPIAIDCQATHDIYDV